MIARRGAGDAGFTLVEVMVALMVMAVAFTIIGTILVSAFSATNRLSATSSAADQIRLTSDRVDRDLRSAVCITSPAEGQGGNTLVFETLSNGVQSLVTYQVTGATLTRQLDLQPKEVVITGVDTAAVVTMASAVQPKYPFSQVASPLRTVVVNLPIRSNEATLSLQTTIAGRNTWRTC